MAQALKQFHRGTSRTPQYLFSVPRYTGRHTVSGAEIVERDWFAYKAAGVQHPGETRMEAEERDARLRRYTTYGLALVILLAVGFAVAMRIF